MKSVAERLHEITERMAKAAKQSGRRAGNVSLIGVVKGQSRERILAAYEAGLRDFAHSYVAEALTTNELRREMPEARWHFIGSIQSNKTRHLLEGWYRIHSIARLKVARRLEGSTILVQVKLGGEATKSGVEPDGLLDLLQDIRRLGTVQVSGLMTLPPPADQLSPAVAFKQLADLADQCTARGLLPETPELSMGMSGDFEEAIKGGARWVRVGQLLFGPRSSN